MLLNALIIIHFKEETYFYNTSMYIYEMISNDMASLLYIGAKVYNYD